MTKLATTAFASLASAFLGRMAVLSTAEGDVNYKIVKLSEQIGSLKDGTKGEYVVLQREGDDAVVISLHPQKAKVLFNKGVEGKLALVDEQADAEVDAVGAAEGDGVAVDEPAAEETKAPSKKAQFMSVYAAGVAAGKSRKDIKADASALGLSDAGFNTYYQNAKSGKWA